DLTDIMGWLRTLNEGMDDTLMALGSEVIHQSDEVYGMLKVQAAKSSDMALNDTVKKIASHLKTGPRKADENNNPTT
ncbi:MAG: hypothetical protein V2A54_00650, partial [Bacteroidota bacterium]